MCDHKTIAETNNFIVLDKYTKIEQQGGGYQTEADLERELIQDLVNQGYEHLPNLTTPEKMLANVRVQLQTLNNMQFSDGEMFKNNRTEMLWLSPRVNYIKLDDNKSGVPFQSGYLCSGIFKNQLNFETIIK